MQSNRAPGTVAMPGRRPFRISVSGFADSSDRQKAISSQMAPMSV